MCKHEWFIIPGGETNGILVLGYWLCVNCKLRGLSTRSRKPL